MTKNLKLFTWSWGRNPAERTGTFFGLRGLIRTSHIQCGDIIYPLLVYCLSSCPAPEPNLGFGYAHLFLLNYHDTNSFKTLTCCVDAAPALVAITIYLVAGGEGWVGVPGRVDMRVSELGTLMMLGVREPPDADNPLWDIDRVGRGCRGTEWAFRFDLNDFNKVFLEENYWLWFKPAQQKFYFRFTHLCDSECGSVNSLGLEGSLCTGLDHMWTEHGTQIAKICLVLIH